MLCMSVTLWATKTLYLAPNSNWTQDNAKFAVYYFGGTGATTDGWSDFMTSVEGETHLYMTAIPDGYPSIIFCRMSNNATACNWSNKWNQSTDISLPTDGKNMFVLATGWDYISGTWTTYSAGMPMPSASSVPDRAPDVMLQAFYWDSYSDHGYGDTRWNALIAQAGEIGSYFDLVWLPPCSQSSGGTGYIPKQYDNLNSDWGSESQLRTLIDSLHNRNTKVVADIVINHNGASCGWCCFAPMTFGSYGTFYPDASWITTNDEVWSSNSGCSVSANAHADDGYGDEANYTAARDWDHLNTDVQAMFRAYLQWMKNDVGFDGWRYDYGKGFHHSHINDYNSAAGAYFSVVEYWDGNAGVLRSRLEDASWNNMAFDFGTKYTALNNGICSFDYSKCQGAGLLGAGLSKHAVTFVDNHDTFTRNDSEFGGKNNSMSSALKDRLLQANAYILSMPGIPCVFYPHWVAYKNDIKPMIEARHLVGVHSESPVTDEEVETGGYKATIQGKNGYMILCLGNKAMNNYAPNFTNYAYGNGYAIWVPSNLLTPPDEPENPEPQPEVPDITVYTLKPAGWNTLNAFVWPNEGNAYKEWPGEAMTKTNTTFRGNDLYSYTFPVTYTKIIFNNGNSGEGNQTADLTVDTAKVYYINNVWYASLEAVPVDTVPADTIPVTPDDTTITPEPQVANVTVYTLKPDAWNALNAFVWPNEGNAYKEWPGEAMTKTNATFRGNDLYSYTFPVTYTKIIFNNGNSGEGNQTADLTVDTTKVYYINDVWYASLEAVPVDTVPADTIPVTPDDTTITPEPVIADGFYLLGTMNGWSATEGYLFAANTENPGEYYLNVTLATNAELKVGKVLNGATVTWYPGEGGNFVVTDEYAGAKTIYFQETYKTDWASYGGYFYIAPNTVTGEDTVNAAIQAVKMLHDGQLLIIRDNRIYTVLGQPVR